MHRIFLATILAISLMCIHAAQPTQSVGLVLSGGGAKGIAHIGVIKALEDNDIPIDYITGTSMGSIVGGLYAAGYTTEEMLQLIASKGFTDWSTGKIDEKLTYYFTQPAMSPAMFKLNLGENDSSKITSVLPTSIINPLPMNFAFLELFAAYTAQCGGNFDNLFVPFRCVTSDVYAKHKVVLSKGSLGDAIRMSMSFPIVFQPIELDGVPMYDGGIYDNFPVDVMMQDFAPDAVIGVDVATPTPVDSRNMLYQLEEMVMQPNHYPFPYDRGVKIHIDLQEFALLDFAKYQQIYDIGYRCGIEMIDSIKAKVHSRVPAVTRNSRRAAFKSRTPHVRFDKVTVTGGTHGQNDYIASLFPHSHSHNPGTFGLDEAKKAYYRAITPGKLQNLVPNAVYNPADSLFDLELKAVVKDRFRVSLGGYISSSTNSMLFLSGGYNTLSYHSLNTDLRLWVGQSYLAARGEAELMLPTSTPSSILFELEATQQKYHETEKLFFETSAPNFITKSEAFGRVLWRMATGRRGRLEAGLGFGHLADRYYANLSVTPGGSRDRAAFNLGQVLARWERNTINSNFNPTGGARYIVKAEGLTGHFDFNRGNEAALPRGIVTSRSRQLTWMQVYGSALNYYGMSRKFALGTEFNLLVSTKPLLRSYDAAIVSAPAFNPTPATHNSFNAALRANSYATAGIIPVWKITSAFQLRSTLHCFMPMRAIRQNETTGQAYYGRWLSEPKFFGEMAAVVSLPFASISAYGNYTSTPARNWNFGLSIGFFLLAPKFL